MVTFERLGKMGLTKILEHCCPGQLFMSDGVMYCLRGLHGNGVKCSQLGLEGIESTLSRHTTVELVELHGTVTYVGVTVE